MTATRRARRAVANRVRPLPVAAAERLREEILAGALMPGARLSEYALCQRLRMGQPTVREALFILAGQGLVKRVANTGTFVTRLDPKEVRNLVEIRAELEVLAAGLAARNAAPEDAAELHRRADAIAATAGDPGYAAYLRADLAFHQKVWVLADNAQLAAILDQLVVPLMSCAARDWRRSREEIKLSGEKHRILADALLRGPDAARRAMRKHIDDFLRTYVKREMRL